MFSITEKAVLQIKQISDDENIGYYSVRAKLKGGGCAGYTRELEFDNVQLETDEVIEMDGVKVFVDHLSFQYLDETTLDYESGLMGGGFRFNSPNATSSCGCGKSVSF